MSRKDYQEMAAILKEARGRFTMGTCDVFIALKTARMFKSDNPAFRPVQYFTACGFTAEEAEKMAGAL